MTGWIWLGLLIFSFGGLTVFFPLLAIFFRFFKRFRPVPITSAHGEVVQLDILIPAFNEADTIRKTLESVLKSCEQLGKDFNYRIVVGLDGPSDQTAAIAHSFGAKLVVHDRKINLGKWKTLSELVASSTGDWTILVDSGTLWSEEFLSKIAPKLRSSRAIGIAPGYQVQAGGNLSRLIWWQERFLKGLENLAGGPISLHGATMIFRTEELKRCFQNLDGRKPAGHPWLNDDVVITFMLRQLGEIDYLGSRLTVGDCGVRPGQSELGRRKRIALGNLQWIRELFLPELFSLSPVLICLSLRRVMRLLWAYQLILSLFFLAMAWSGDLVTSLAVAFTPFILFAASRSLREAAIVSLTVPFLILKKSDSSAWN